MTIPAAEEEDELAAEANEVIFPEVVAVCTVPVKVPLPIEVMVRFDGA